MLMQHKEKVYESVKHGDWQGWVEKPVLQSEPFMSYTGAKIPFALWYQIVAWFQKHAKDEVQVRLFRNVTTRQWTAAALPQYYPSGMTTKEVEDHADRKAILEAMTQAGFYEFGTVHHHCSASAFQSSTDSADEKDKAGLHITVGKMDQREHDIHGRVTVKIPGELNPDGSVKRAAVTGQYEVAWSQWFELPDGVVVPAALAETVVQWALRQSTKSAYPEEWDKRLIERPSYGYGGSGYWNDNWEWKYKSNSEAANGHASFPSSWKTPQEKTEQAGTPADSTANRAGVADHKVQAPLDRVVTELLVLAEEGNLDPADMAAVIRSGDPIDSYTREWQEVAHHIRKLVNDAGLHPGDVAYELEVYAEDAEQAEAEAELQQQSMLTWEGNA